MTGKSITILIALTTLAAAFFLSGCDSPQQVNRPSNTGTLGVASEEPPKSPKVDHKLSEVHLPRKAARPPWLDQREKKSADPLSGLLVACARTDGAAFDRVTSTCECSDQNNQARVFVPNQIQVPERGGTCVALAPARENWSHRVRGSLVNIRILDHTKVGGEKNEFTGNGLKVRAWNPFLMSGFTDMVGLTVGKKPLVVVRAEDRKLPYDQYSQLFEYEQPNYFNDDQQLIFYRTSLRLLYAAHAEEIPLALGSVKLGRDIIDSSLYSLNKVPENGPPESLNLSKTHALEAEVARAAYSAYLEYVFHNTQLSGEDHFNNVSDTGCLGFCVATRTLRMPELFARQGHRAEEVRVISQGTLAHHFIRIEGPGDRFAKTEGLLALNRAGALSVIALLEGTETEKEQKIETRIFNRYWEELTPERSIENGSQKSLVFTVSQGADTWKSKLRDPRLGLTELKVGETPVVVCEDEFSPDVLEKNGILSRLMIGDQANSVYGWAPDSPANSPATSMDGWVSMSSIGETGWNDPILYSHAYSVAKAVLETGPHSRIIPISGNRCLSLGAEDFQFLHKKGARVFSVSFIDSQDDAVCAEKYARRLHSSSKDILWVLAAGNDAKNKDSSSVAWLCPQSYLAGRGNSVLVAGLEGQKIWADSNVGENFADIAADASSGSGMGTSFAAPRVSGVAAEIFSRFPRLRPEQVRLAILISADIPVVEREVDGETKSFLNTLPVRSGGVLNREKALMAAEEIADQAQYAASVRYSVELLKKILSRLHCSPPISPDYCNEVATARLALLDRNEVLNSFKREDQP